ncbi:MAG: hypothetical protein ABFD81_16450 [Syntrophaceae bacterium]
MNDNFIGIETPNEASLKEAGKTNNLRSDLLQAVQTIHAGGLEVMGGFIVEFDHGPTVIFERRIDFTSTAASSWPWWDCWMPCPAPEAQPASASRRPSDGTELGRQYGR